MATTKKTTAKTIKTLSILELAMQATKANIKATSRKKSILDMLYSRIYNPSKPNEGIEMSKTELITQISLERLELEFENRGEELTPEAFQTEETEKLFKSINKTVKNGFETAVCNGSTQASFNSNKRYKDRELLKLSNNKYVIVDRQS